MRRTLTTTVGRAPSHNERRAGIPRSSYWPDGRATSLREKWRSGRARQRHQVAFGARVMARPRTAALRGHLPAPQEEGDRLPG